ncbi:MAG TPA: helix-turn-helix domain-containing protein [Solirubrobacterales bacterium]|nr:helix-turn-helix domain-containing protein [Solirubrobacterales bacterium]
MTETGKGELSAYLAERLPLELRGALEHPCRRRILRALREDGGHLSAAEIRARGCTTCTLPCVTYHLGVLVESRLVRRLGAGSVRGRLEYAFAATLDGHPMVVEVLQATAASDGLRPQPAPAS